jgi:hypothetical protein
MSTASQFTLDCLAEAERLALLPADLSAQIIALIRAPATDPKVSKADRVEARRLADGLQRPLRRLQSKKKK